MKRFLADLLDNVTHLWSRAWLAETMINQNNVMIYAAQNRFTRRVDVEILITTPVGEARDFIRAFDVEAVTTQDLAQLTHEVTPGMALVWIWKMGVQAPTATWYQDQEWEW